MPSEPLSGGCLCGAVRFELTAPPVKAGYCHCTRCQKRTGTASSAQVRVEPGSVRLTKGVRSVRTWKPGDGFGKSFCMECGAHLFSRNPQSGDIFSVRMSALDEDPGVPLTFRQFVDDAASWEPIPDDGLERFPGSAR